MWLTPWEQCRKKRKQSRGSSLRMEALTGRTLTYLCLRFARSRVCCVSFARRKAAGRSWRRRSVCWSGIRENDRLFYRQIDFCKEVKVKRLEVCECTSENNKSSSASLEASFVIQSVGIKVSTWGKSKQFYQNIILKIITTWDILVSKFTFFIRNWRDLGSLHLSSCNLDLKEEKMFLMIPSTC